MKKWMRWISLVLAMAATLSVTVLADDAKDGVTISDKFSGSTAKFMEEEPGKIQVTVTSPSITPGNQYVIVMVKGLDENPIITKSKILYMDQKAAEDAGNGNGTLTFKLFPANIGNSVILICGVVGNQPGSIVLAVVNGKFLLGDANGDGAVNAADASMILQYSVRLIDESAFSFEAADVNHSESVSSADASIILQVVAGYIPSLG